MKSLTIPNQKLCAVMILILFLILVGSCLLTKSQEATGNHEWSMQIETEPLVGYPSGHGLLKPFTRVFVTYPSDPNSSSSSSRYEEFWYTGSEAIGNTKSIPLTLPTGSGIGIELSHHKSSTGYEEQCVATDALMRVLLDLYLHGHTITNITLPRSSFMVMVNRLGQYGFYALPPGQTESDIGVAGAAISLGLQSKPAGMEMIMVYNPS